MKRCTTRIKTAILCMFLSIMLAFVPLSVQASFSPITANSERIGLYVQKSEAQAIPPVVVAGGAALAALAADLGISEAALLAGLAAVGVGITGMAVSNVAQYTDTTLPPAPGFKPWDDLTPEEKSIWGDMPNTGEEAAATYQKNALAWWAIQYGLLESSEGGGFEPAPQPDPEENPDAASNWQKARNVLVALAASGAGVALDAALTPFVDMLSSNVKNLLFGNDANGLGLLYTGQVSVDGRTAQMRIVDLPTQSFNSNGHITTIDSTTWFDYREYVGGNYHIYTVPFENRPFDIVFVKDGNNLKATYGNDPIETGYPRGQAYKLNAAGTAFTSFGGRQYSELTTNLVQSTQLNPLYAGSYIFPSATFSNGVWTGDYSYTNVEYGQMTDTPPALETSILNNNQLINYFNNYTVSGNDGESRALIIPAWLTGSEPMPNEVQYSDFVSTMPDNQLTPIPDDEPLPGPEPNPNPIPDDLDYQEEFGDTVLHLLTQPFEQLFPFCLITDLQRLCNMLSSAVYTEDNGSIGAQSITVLNGTESFTLPLESFGFDNVDFEIDLQPLSDLAVIVRPFLTALFITGLLVGTFRFFLTRGGE